MIEKIIRGCLRHRFFVLILLSLLVSYGAYAALKLPVDAFPDVTNVQVQVLTTWPGMSPVEVEQQISFPIEVALAGLPDMVELRSLSKFGLSVVTICLPPTALRQRSESALWMRHSLERLLSAELPAAGPADHRADCLARDAALPSGADLPPRLADLERTALLRALEQHRGNRTRAADALGISVRTLQRKLKKWRERP